MQIVTHEQCVARMKQPGDEDRELRLDKQYVRRLKNRYCKMSSLDEKIRLEQSIRDAEEVLRKLRLNIFKLEDRLRVQAQ